MTNLLNNPRILILVIALVLVSGLSALQVLPRAEDPRIGNRIASVLTVFPGASAERVEALVTERLEQKLREIPEIEHIDSRSSAGLSVMVVQLEDAVAFDDTKALWAEVRDKLAEGRYLLPMGVDEPRLDDKRGSAFTVILSLNWKGKSEPDLLVLGRYAEELKSRLRNVAGTDYIRLQGQPEEEILVSVNAAEAALLGLDAERLGAAILASDAKVSAGEMNNNQQRLSIEVEGSLDTAERIRQMPLAISGVGSAARVADIATVERVAKTPMSSQVIVEGSQAVVVAVRMLADQRGDQWDRHIHEAVARFEQQLPANIEIQWLFNQERYTDIRLSGLVKNVTTGFVLIALVLWVTLGWRAALIVVFALPLIVLFAMSCMNYTGVPIHQMSVTGLIVALGIMVDNAIVMADTVGRYKREGFDGRKAAFAAVSHLWVPLLGSTLTTVLAFMPIVLMSGPSGEFVGSISLTVIFSLIGSYIISHLVVAGLAGRFLPRDIGTAWYQQGLVLKPLSARFKFSVRWAATHPWRVLLAVFALPLLGFFASSTLPSQFFPPSDRDMLNVEVYLPVSASVTSTRELTARISQELADVEGIESLHWFVGGNAPSFYYNLTQRRDGAQFYAQAMLTADHFSTANALVPVLQKRLDDKFPEAQILIRRLEQGPPFNAPVEIRLFGPSIDQLQILGDEMRQRLLGLENVVHIRSSLSETIPKVWLGFDEHQARLAGLSLTAAATQLRMAVDGVGGGSVLEDTQSLAVRVVMDGYRNSELNDINSWLMVPSQPQRSGLSLSALGEVNVLPALGLIPRRDGERVNTIEVYIRDGVLPDDVLSQAKLNLANNALLLPSGYRIEIGGEDEKRSRAIGKLLASLGLIVVLLVVAVVMSFNSFRLSAIIFITAVLAAGLGLLSLFLYQSPFGFTAIIGLMALIGLAINAAIVILAELKTSEAAVRGDIDAVVAGVTACGRHIISTTITTVMGFMPLLLEGGAFWPPFAVVIAGGTVLTTLLSFYFVPVLFLLMGRYRAFDAKPDVDMTLMDS